MNSVSDSHARLVVVGGGVTTVKLATLPWQ